MNVDKIKTRNGVSFKTTRTIASVEQRLWELHQLSPEYRRVVWRLVNGYISVLEHLIDTETLQYRKRGQSFDDYLSVLVTTLRANGRAYIFHKYHDRFYFVRRSQLLEFVI